MSVFDCYCTKASSKLPSLNALVNVSGRVDYLTYPGSAVPTHTHTHTPQFRKFFLEKVVLLARALSQKKKVPSDSLSSSVNVVRGKVPLPDLLFSFISNCVS